MRSRSLAATLILSCAMRPAAVLSAQTAHSSSVDMRQQSVVATRTNKRGFQTWLAVDRDDVIREIGKEPGDPKGPVVEANLGVRIKESGGLPLASLVPSDKVPVSAKRVSLSNGARIHVVVAWGFSSDSPGPDTPICHLFVTQEEGGKVKQLVHQELGEAIIQFIVEDLYGDGKFEVLVTTQNYGFQIMNIWQIQPNGKIREIQTIDGDQVHTLQDRFMTNDLGITAWTKAQNCEGAELCYSVTQYKWSPKQSRYVPIVR